MHFLIVTAVGWRPKGADGDFRSTNEVGRGSFIRLERAGTPGKRATRVEVNLIIEDSDAFEELAEYRMSDTELEWIFQVRELNQPVYVPLGWKSIRRSGEVSLMHSRIDRDLIGELGLE